MSLWIVNLISIASILSYICMCGSVFRIRIRIQEAPGSNTDPDPQHWLKIIKAKTNGSGFGFLKSGSGSAKNSGSVRIRNTVIRIREVKICRHNTETWSENFSRILKVLKYSRIKKYKNVSVLLLLEIFKFAITFVLDLLPKAVVEADPQYYVC